jgi:hypothetical protein
LELRIEAALRKQTEEKPKESYVDLTLAHREFQGFINKFKTVKN